MHRRTVERAVQIVSEAARALPPDFLAKYSDAPWSSIVGIGNILRHEYQRLDDKQLWEIATVHSAAIAADRDANAYRTRRLKTVRVLLMLLSVLSRCRHHGLTEICPGWNLQVDEQSGDADATALMRCRPVSVSVGRLMEFLNVLGQDVEVTVKPATRRKAGDMSVVVRA